MRKRFVIFSLISLALGANGVRPRLREARTIQNLTIQRTVHLARPGSQDSRYAYVPFDVPEHTIRINVGYQYDRANGNNTIDLGVFDSRSSNSETDPTGFRGWSGGRRSEFFISRNEATPGYLPGALPSGTWRVILGLYNVAASGVDVSIKVEIETEKGSPPASIGDVPVASSTPDSQKSANKEGRAGMGLHWWGGDLHMHTVHSDGDWTVAELVDNARKIGLDFICVTDHNTSSHHAEIDRARMTSQQPLILRGEEITTYGGHTNAWGLPSGMWVDFRVRPGDTARISSIAAQVHNAGALISINHPFSLCGGCSWSYEAQPRDFDAIEVWNGAWDPTDEQALLMWDAILQSGRAITAIGSSDSHRPATPIGQPTTHVAANVLEEKALLQAIRQGHVYLTSNVARRVIGFQAETKGSRGSRWIAGDEVRFGGPHQIRFSVTSADAPAGSTISLMSNGRKIRSFMTRANGRPQIIDLDCRSNSYFRLELRDKDRSMLALTNPIYVKFGVK